MGDAFTSHGVDHLTMEYRRSFVDRYEDGPDGIRRKVVRHERFDPDAPRVINRFALVKGEDRFVFTPDPFAPRLVVITHNGEHMTETDVDAARDFYKEKLAEGYRRFN
ncbi:hypothetical protein KR100_09845 [Synechococcus sp. KORDI-100]|uniref:hypothetical protein n=1 Tax=Synechococcus sp. KORDI-100 TaxID=1280380 RepID=UPI0004E03D6B|nr:hypothetical protein [Synechococcus sp. KORDI-100]AII43662.1 hypothetical protein KR100_09845 [Synechococcus sp. KORDI-100]